MVFAVYFLVAHHVVGDAVLQPIEGFFLHLLHDGAVGPEVVEVEAQGQPLVFGLPQQLFAVEGQVLFPILRLIRGDGEEKSPSEEGLLSDGENAITLL